MDQPKWTWQELLTFQIQRSFDRQVVVSSRVFPYDGVSHSMLAGIDPENRERIPAWRLSVIVELPMPG